MLKKITIQFACSVLLLNYSVQAKVINNKPAANVSSSVSSRDLFKKGEKSISLYTTNGYLQGIKLFDQAYQLDKKFIQALAAKSKAQALLGLKLRTYKNSYKKLVSEKDLKEIVVDPDKLIAEAKNNALLALKSDKNSVYAHSSLTLISCNSENTNSDCAKGAKLLNKIDPKNAESYYLLWLAEQSSNNKKPDMKLITKSLTINPDYIPSLYTIGTNYMNQENYKEAINTFNRISKLSPEYSQTYFRLGAINLKLKEIDKGIINTKKAINLFPYDEFYHELLGDLYFANKNYDQAISSYEKASELFPEDGEYPLKISRVYSTQGRMTEAIQELEKAIKLNPNDSFYYSRLADIYLDKNQYDDALKYYQKSFSLDKNEYAYYEILDVYENQKNYELATNWLKNIPASLKGDMARYYIEFASLYLKQDKFEEGIKAAQQSIAINPKDDNSHSILAKLYLKQNRYEEAIKEYEIANKLQPDNYYFYQIASIYFGALKKTDKALDVYKEGYKFNTKDIFYMTVYLDKISNILVSQKKYDQALKMYELAIDKNPTNKDLVYALNAFYFQQKKFKEMVAFSQDRLHIFPSDSTLYSDLGLAYFESGDIDLSIETLLYAIKLNNKSGIAHHNLGRVYYSKGRYTEAKKEFEEACSLDSKDSCDFLKSLNVQVG